MLRETQLFKILFNSISNDPMYHRFIKIWGIGEPVTIRSDIKLNSLPQTETNTCDKTIKTFLYAFRALKWINNDTSL